MKKILAVAILSALGVAQAEAETLSWTPSVDTTVVGYHVYRRLCSGGSETTLDVPGRTTSTVQLTFSVGVHCLQITAYRANGQESVRVPEPALQHEVLGPVGPPSNVTITVTTAYELRRKSDGDFHFVNVGRVPRRTPCQEKLVGQYHIAGAAPTLTRPLQGGIVAVKCS